MEGGKKVERLKNWKGTVSLGSWPTIERRDETYYDPSFCPLAARNKHLLRHRVKGEEGWRRAIDVDCRGTRSPPVHATYFPSKSFLLPRSHFPQTGERNGGVLPRRGKTTIARTALGHATVARRRC